LIENKIMKISDNYELHELNVFVNEID